MSAHPFKLLKEKSFRGLFISQATGAFNDNALKMILIGVFMAITPKEEHGSYLSLLNFLLIAPFVVFAPFAGWISDRFSKRNVLITFKMTEFVILSIATLAIIFQETWPLLLMMVLMGTQSAFFSPAKYGILKELSGEKRLPQANGIIEWGTILAIVLGTVIGAILFDFFQNDTKTLIPIIVLMTLSFIGIFFTFKIQKLENNTTEDFSIGAFFKNFKSVISNKKLFVVILGLMWFWFVAMLLNLLLILFGTQTMGLDGIAQASLLFLYLAFGVSIGSFLAGKIRFIKTQAGLIPIGAFGMGAFAFLLPQFYEAYGSYKTVVINLIMLGTFGGLYLVPLNTLVQYLSPDEVRGRNIAITNLFTYLGMMFSSLGLYLMSKVFALNPSEMLLILGFLSLIAGILTIWAMPEEFFTILIDIFLNIFYRIRLNQWKNIPHEGPLILTPNHVSYIDGLITRYAFPHRKIRYVVYEDYYKAPLFGWFLKIGDSIKIKENSKDSIKEIIRALEKGDALCIFPEGSLTRTGILGPFKKGLELILRLAPKETKVIPLYIDGLWGSIFSFKDEKFFWKRPKRFPYPVSLYFGEALSKDLRMNSLRKEVIKLGEKAYEKRVKTYKPLYYYFLKNTKKRLFKNIASDILIEKISGLKFLSLTLLLNKKIRPLIKDEASVGLAFPPSIVGNSLNVAVNMLAKVSVNLNFTAGSDTLKQTIEKAKINKVICSRKLIEKLNITFPEQVETIYIEDITDDITKAEKITTAFQALFLPVKLIEKQFCREQRATDLATILFSSGATGTPKGIPLTNANIFANIEMVNESLYLNKDARLLGSLPFFHSFGFTFTLWYPLIESHYIGYTPSPLDIKTVKKTITHNNLNVLITTPSFLSMYTKNIKKEDLACLRKVITGAEKLTDNIRHAFMEKFPHVTILEGYGVTEASPVISLNTPNYIAEKTTQINTKEGTVGKPLNGIQIKITAQDGHHNKSDNVEEVSHLESGMLNVKGTNIMSGYLDDQEKTDEAFTSDGFYITGDIARFDEEGFLHIVDRVSRFSKIAGEMVPHGKIEDILHKALEFKERILAVTSIEDEQKGERLIVLHKAEVKDKIKDKSLMDELKHKLPNLWIPKDFFEIPDLPILGSGKLDLKKLKEMAKKLFKEK